MLRAAGAGEEMRSVDAEVRCLGAIVGLFCVGNDGWGRERLSAAVGDGQLGIEARCS